MIRRAALALLLTLAAATGTAAAADKDDEVTVGYQLIYGPWALPMKAGAFEQGTGFKINWVKFDTGAKVLTAMASSQVQIGVVGSSPAAAGASQGIDYQLFYILDDIAASEALVVRDGSGIDPANPATLKGKKVGVPFVSTTHFHLLFALETWGIKPADLEILNMAPNQLAAAWERGDVDAGFVWNPALARLKKDGKVMVTSGELSAKGKPTFDGLVVMRAFAEDNPDFMARFVRLIADADAAYRDNKAAWGADSVEAKTVAEVFGGEPADVSEGLGLMAFPSLAEQASTKWLAEGAVTAMKATAEFLKAQGRIDLVQPDYAKFVTSRWVEAAAKLGK